MYLWDHRCFKNNFKMTVDYYFSLTVFWIGTGLVERAKAMNQKRLLLKSRSAK